MSPCAPGIRRRALGALGFVWLSIAGADPAATVSPAALQACARVTADAERLACYDRLARTAAAPAAAAPAAATADSAAHPAQASAPVAPAPTPARAAPPVAPPPGSTSFGLYAAEHPHPSVANSLEAPITAVGQSASGHTTVSLEGGAVWELDEPDPLLHVGDVVTITRATLGSYLMHTPTRRTHRVRRLH